MSATSYQSLTAPFSQNKSIGIPVVPFSNYTTCMHDWETVNIIDFSDFYSKERYKKKT